MSTVDKKKDTTTPKTALELLEEDDEFEVGKKLIWFCRISELKLYFTEFYIDSKQEFEGSSWEDLAGQAESTQLFQDDWEDDNSNDDFTEQLRAQIGSS